LKLGAYACGRASKWQNLVIHMLAVNVSNATVQKKGKYVQNIEKGIKREKRRDRKQRSASSSCLKHGFITWT